MSALHRGGKPGVRLNCETLEDRAVPAAAFTLSGTNLLAFDTANPAVTTGTAITGVGANEALVGLDFRADGSLYALGVNHSANTATLYTVSAQTGQAAAVGATGSVKFVATGGAAVDLPDPATVGYGLDFDPVSGHLRVVTGNGLTFRVDPNGAPVDGDTGTGKVVTGTNTDGAITGLPTGSTGVSATAFAADGTQYSLDTASDALFVQDALTSGTQTGRLDLTLNGAPLNFTRANGFDISADGAFAALTVNNVARLYQIDLTTGAATDLGATASGITGLALVAPAGTIEFTGATFVATEAGLAAEVTLARTGGTAGAVEVTVTATDGTATAGPDFMPGPYTVTFADGQATATLLILLDNLDDAEPDETFDLALSAPTGGAAIGAQATATVTITDGGTPPAPPVMPGDTDMSVGSGAGAGAVNVLTADGTVRSGFLPYGDTMLAGVRVATGDVTGDGVDDVITTPMMGAAHVKVFDGATGAEVRSFLAFDAGFLGGLTVASGDVNADGYDDIIVGTATGSSHVKVISGATGTDLASFFAYGTFGGGVTVASGDVNGDGRADIVTGTATGLSHVKVFAGGNLAVLQSTYAFIGHTGGVNVAAGDVNGDGFADVVVGTATGAAQVKVYSGKTKEVLHNFRAFAGHMGGVNVAVGDANGDGLADILVSTASGTSHVKGFDGGTGAEVNSFLAFGAGFSGGVFIS